MSIYFTGERWIVEPHYGRLDDPRSKPVSFDTQGEALDAKDRHNAAGANVQVYRHCWREVKEANGWYPSRETLIRAT